MINNLLDADDTDNADLFLSTLNPRYPCHPRLKNNIPNGANHLSLNTNHFCSFLYLNKSEPAYENTINKKSDKPL